MDKTPVDTFKRQDPLGDAIMDADSDDPEEIIAMKLGNE